MRYGVQRDLARDLSEYAKMFDQQMRAEQGIMIFAGHISDLDRAYQFPVQRLSDVAESLQGFDKVEAVNQDTRYLFFFGATPDQDQVYAIDSARFDRFRNAMPGEMLCFDLPPLASLGIGF